MSRASDLRDAIVAELKGAIAAKVRPIVVIDYGREELDEPIVGVRVMNREAVIDMGPDTRSVMMQITVVGLKADDAGYDSKNPDAYREREIKLVDKFDNLFESCLALWTPDGPLSRKYLADHRFNALGLEMAYDVAHYHENGIYIAPFTVTYIDTIDEDQ